MKFFDLSGKVAIITGGNGGLGLGIAIGLAKEGCAVALVGRNQDKIDKMRPNVRIAAHHRIERKFVCFDWLFCVLFLWIFVCEK